MTPTRICLVGHSGSGKSTTAAMIHDATGARHLTCEVIKVGAPLYELQQRFYARLGHPLPAGQQDQQLLEGIARWVRKRQPQFLVEDFLDRAERVHAQVLVNDDVRSYDFDYPELRRRGWTAVRVSAPEELRGKRLAAQGYLSLSDASTAGVDDIGVDFEIRNDTTIAALRSKVGLLMERVLPC
ncbi:ATP-binding protein [Nocardia alni]|uniref:ATP-binding protein n=1 Tax=Nocardia alni TaxID=2815723 RepID=UPI001C21B7FC|nr:ATP-binding protein [Nocardia alni]